MEAVLFRLVLVGSGGFLGAVFRYLLSGFVQTLTKSIGFPYGTMVVNIVGCLLIGVLSQMDELRGILSTETRLLLLVGVLGAFTTFSTFSNETLNLLTENKIGFALLNVVVSVTVGLGAVWIGRVLSSAVWR
jgi:fluoride exporter